MPSTAPEVLVVGAGPVGLVAACELARQGVRPRLVDRLEEPSYLSRAVIVHARSQEMLAALGALDGVEARARRTTAIEAHFGDGGGAQLVRIDMSGMPTRYPRILSLPQSDTEAALAARAAELGIEIERGVEVTGLHQSEAGVAVTIRSDRAEETTTVDWVVGADGAHSTVRSLVGTALVGSFHGQHFVFADVDGETVLAKDALHMFAHRDGIAALFPMAGERVRLLFEVPAPAPGTEPTLDDVRRLVDERLGGRLQVGSSHWLTYFEVHHGQVPQYRFDRVLLAGDAAHIHSPAGGQGMNTGMQDAANLAWKLALVAQGRADPSLLDSYESERYPIAASVVRMTTAMTTAMTAHGVAGVLRGWALFAAGHTSTVTDTAAARLAELTVGYPHSAIVGHAHHQHARALHPGAHAAEVPGLQGPTAGPVAIGDLLRQPGHLVLARSHDLDQITGLGQALGDLGTVVHVVDDRSQNGAVPNTVIDPGGELAKAYGLGDDGFVAIRPDGYIGFLATPAEPEALRRYLSDHLAVPAGR